MGWLVLVVFGGYVGAGAGAAVVAPVAGVSGGGIGRGNLSGVGGSGAPLTPQAVRPSPKRTSRAARRKLWAVMTGAPRRGACGSAVLGLPPRRAAHSPAPCRPGS